jgi:tetratricopeptide (TPR) repeat protein
VIAISACAERRRHPPVGPTAQAPAAAAVPAAQEAPEPALAHPQDDTPLDLPFIHDDYARAREEAKSRSVPLFVDVWASWCHTCLSMKQYVLRDPALRPVAERYVWLAIDSEKGSNKPFLAQFPSRSLPTLWVIDPHTEAPQLKWIGTATAAELRSLLDDALNDRMLADLAAARNPAIAGAAAEATAIASNAHRLSAQGKSNEAIEAYRRALSVAPQDWVRRPRTIEALSMRLAETEQRAAVADLAAREAASMPDGTARLNVVLNGIDAATELPAEAPERAALAGLLQLGTRIATTESTNALLDDRSNLTLTLVRALADADPAESKRLAIWLRDSLDKAAASAGDTASRMVWDPHRVEAYLAAGEPERAIPMLELSERERPDDYNPPARLARVYLALGKHAPARAAIDRALARSDGPRKLRFYILKADIAVAAKDKPAARKALREALEFARRSQLPAQYDALRESIERKARELG